MPDKANRKFLLPSTPKSAAFAAPGSLRAARRKGGKAEGDFNISTFAAPPLCLRRTDSAARPHDRKKIDHDDE